MRYFFLSLLFILSTSSVYAANPAVNNAGFVQSNIWYSKDPFYAGDKIRIYTVIFNGSAYDLSGSVEFLDNGMPIESVRFSISSGGRVQDLWTNWTAIEGKHTITARFANVIADGPEGKQAVLLANTEAGKSERTVDLDPAVKEAQAKAAALRAEEKKAEVVQTIEQTVGQVNAAIPAPVKESVSSGVLFIEEFRTKEAEAFRAAREKKQEEIRTQKEQVRTTDTGSTVAKSTGSKQGSVESEQADQGVSGTLSAVSSKAEQPLAYVMVAILATLQYVFEWSVLFYGVLFYVLYRLLRWGIARVRNR